MTRWVLDETRSLCPRWFSAFFLGVRQALPLVFLPGATEIRITTKQVVAPLALLSRSDVPSTLLSPKPVEVDAILPQTEFLTRQIEVPTKAIMQMRSIASLDLARRTPFRAGEVEWTLSTPRVNGDRASSTQWLLHRDDLQRLKERLATARMTLRRVWVDGQPDTVLPVVDLTQRDVKKRNLWVRANGLISAMLLGVCGFTWLLPAIQNAQALAPEQAALENLRGKALAMRQEIETLRQAADERSAFLHSMTYRTRLGETLREATIALPDDVWLTELNFSQTGILLMGETAHSAADLVIDLADTRQFENPRLSGSVSRSANGGEQFELAIDHRKAP